MEKGGAITRAALSVRPGDLPQPRSPARGGTAGAGGTGGAVGVGQATSIATTEPFKHCL